MFDIKEGKKVKSFNSFTKNHESSSERQKSPNQIQYDYKYVAPAIF